jgi:predicted alpha-1,2-mannosidase
MKKIMVFLLLFMVSEGFALQKNLVQYVNTLQGTDSHFELSYGNTYPAVALPFGLHFWSAQTGKNGNGWKYQYSSETIRGFQQTHQCSPWMNDYGVFSLMPVSKLIVDEDKRASKFSHANEIGKPHYYRVQFDNGIITEISPAERAAHFRFTFAENQDAFIIFDGYVKDSRINIDPENRRITGYVNNGGFVPENFKNYFVIQFDQSFIDFGTWDNERKVIDKSSTTILGKKKGAYLQFKRGTKVQAKAASSYISPEQAQLTLMQEIGSHKKLEDTKSRAEKVWNDLLKRILVEGGTEEQTRTFYSCLFRANLFSRKFYETDVNGNPHYYSPYDGKLYQGYMFSDNGFWDTFRSQFPLTNILHPTMQGRYMVALLDAQEQCGWLPSWSAPNETGGMIGNHAISLLADAWAKGIRTFDPERALKAYLHEATNKGPGRASNGRPFWKEYYQLGYIPYPESNGSTAQTLESAYDDFCGYQLAKMIGNGFYQSVFARQMYNYKNVFDPSAGFMRGRKITGEWADFDKYEWGGPYIEGNAYHYTWSVFHDVQGLINLMGGDKAFVAKLDSVFMAPNTVKYGTYRKEIHEMREMQLAGMGQYAQGNQPVQHSIYLYAYAGQPWKTQYWIRQVMDRLYNSTEKGYPGDEDQGGLSSWYVLSALGIYSVCPGTDEYVTGSPLFPKATITLKTGKNS